MNAPFRTAALAAFVAGGLLLAHGSALAFFPPVTKPTVLPPPTTPPIDPPPTFPDPPPTKFNPPPDPPPIDPPGAPEPATLLSAALGLGTLAGLGWRRRRLAEQA